MQYKLWVPRIEERRPFQRQEGPSGGLALPPGQRTRCTSRQCLKATTASCSCPTGPGHQLELRQTSLVFGSNVSARNDENIFERKKMSGLLSRVCAALSLSLPRSFPQQTSILEENSTGWCPKLALKQLKQDRQSAERTLTFTALRRPRLGGAALRRSFLHGCTACRCRATVCEPRCPHGPGPFLLQRPKDLPS